MNSVWWDLSKNALKFLAQILVIDQRLTRRSGQARNFNFWEGRNQRTYYKNSDLED